MTTSFILNLVHSHSFPNIFISKLAPISYKLPCVQKRRHFGIGNYKTPICCLYMKAMGRDVKEYKYQRHKHSIL
jgi:hypothetical protein